MNRYGAKAMTIGLGLVAALAIAACGSDDATTAADSSGGSETVAVATIGDAGEVLVDANGAALYSPDQEADGKILCTSSCEAIWKPLTVGGSTQPSASSDVSGTVDTVERPDGSEQVALDGAPLYTFTEEGPNEVTGDGFADSFDGQDFTWQVVGASGTASAGGSSTTTDSDSTGGYSY